MAPFTLPTDIVIPKGSALEAIEDTYGPLPQEVLCGLANCREPHKNGFVVLFRGIDPGSPTRRGMIGRDCGKREFGENWLEASHRFVATKRQIQIAEMGHDFRTVAAELRPKLCAALPALRRYRDIHRALIEHADWLMRLCVDAVRNRNGQLGFERNDGFVPVHRIRGGLWFVQDRALDRAEEMLAIIDRTESFLAEGSAPVRQVGDRLRMVGDLRHQWGNVEREMVEAAQAVRPSAMTQLLKVACRLTERDSVRMDGEVLEVRIYGPPPYYRESWRRLPLTMDAAEAIID